MEEKAGVVHRSAAAPTVAAVVVVGNIPQKE